jgi:hypothetical protein
MWLFLTRRLRVWLIVTVSCPAGHRACCAGSGRALSGAAAHPAVSRALLQAGDLGDRARDRLRGGRRRR